MTKEEIKNAAISACKSYGYDWVMADFQYEDGDDILKELRKEMRENGHCQTQIFGGDEPYYALERANSDDVDMMDVMEDCEIFTESDVYRWINLGRIDAWKELFHRKKKTVGYYCNGYCGYVFFPEYMDVNNLKRNGEVVIA